MERPAKIYLFPSPGRGQNEQTQTNLSSPLPLERRMDRPARREEQSCASRSNPQLPPRVWIGTIPLTPLAHSLLQRPLTSSLAPTTSHAPAPLSAWPPPRELTMVSSLVTAVSMLNS